MTDNANVKQERVSITAFISKDTRDMKCNDCSKSIISNLYGEVNNAAIPLLKISV